MTREQQAREYHSRGYSCSQAVYSTYTDLLGMGDAQAKRASSSWAGGAMVKCGAVYSAMMILEKQYADAPDEKTRKWNEFSEKYIAENGSLDCRKLLASRAKNRKSCRDYVGSASRILDEVLSGQ